MRAASSPRLLRLWFRPRVAGRENVPASGPVILAPVHRSFADFGFTAFCTDRKLFFMAKDSLWKNPWLGRLLLYVGAFPVHRESADREALQRAEEVLARGQCLVLFPEGTRREGPVIENLMEGAAFLSARTGAPIVPIGIGASDLSMPKGSAIPKPYTIPVVIGPALPAPARTGGGRVSRSAVHAGTETARREAAGGLRRGQGEDRALLSMCGIVGCVGYRDSVPMVLDGLARLEYRGYDSAGMAVLDRGHPEDPQGQGEDRRPARHHPGRTSPGLVGIGHTRWATHGVPNEVNAHPHTDPTGRIALVHNGIIENAEAIKDSLQAQGHQFRSDTDSEVLAHLIALSGAPTLVEAVCEALSVRSRAPTASR